MHHFRSSLPKGLTKLAILPDCLALPPSRKVPKLDFHCEFSMSKIIRIFGIFPSLKNKNLGAHFTVKIWLPFLEIFITQALLL